MLAFLLSWAEAKRLGLTSVASEFARFAVSVRTRLLLLPDQDEYERRRWSEQEKNVESAEQMALWGWARIQALVAVKLSLQTRNLPHDPAAVSKWFSSVSFAVSSDKVTPKTVAAYLKVHERFQAEEAIAETILDMDCRFARQHILANISTLSHLCSRTSTPNHPQVQDKLLLWVVQGLAVQQLRGNIEAVHPSTP